MICTPESEKIGTSDISPGFSAFLGHERVKYKTIILQNQKIKPIRRKIKSQIIIKNLASTTTKKKKKKKPLKH
jgi:hypothetical protein